MSIYSSVMFIVLSNILTCSLIQSCNWSTQINLSKYKNDKGEARMYGTTEYNLTYSFRQIHLPDQTFTITFTHLKSKHQVCPQWRPLSNNSLGYEWWFPNDQLFSPSPSLSPSWLASDVHSWKAQWKQVHSLS